MATLTGRTVGASYIELLKLNTASNNTGVTESLLDVTDGGNTASALSISTSQIASTVDGSAGTAAFTRKGDTNTGVFFPAADTIAVTTTGTERMRITSAGNVGIGTTSPDEKLDVNGFAVLGTDVNTGQASTKFHKFKGTALQTGASWFGSYGGLLLDSTEAFTSTARKFLITNSLTANKFAIIRSTTATTDPSLGDAGAITSGTADFVITNTGNVGIGTTSPVQALSVVGASGTTFVSSITSQVATGAYIGFLDTTTTDRPLLGAVGNNFAIRTANTERLRIDSTGNVGIGTASPTGQLHVIGSTGAGAATGNSIKLFAGAGGPTAGAGGDIILSSGANGAGGINGNIIFQAGSTEFARINSSGNVGIGMTPTAQLELSTDSAKKPSTNTWTIASDQRLKTNITNADNDRCYEIVKQVPLKRYTWKSEVYSQDKVKDRSKLGWIAQDVEAVFPKAVGTNRFAYNQVFEDVVTPELDSEGNAIFDEQGVAKTKTEKRLVSEEVIEDCKDLNSDQIYAAMYGTIQKLIEKVETLEAKVLSLQAA